MAHIILTHTAAGIEALELIQSLADRFIGQGFIDAPQGRYEGILAERGMVITVYVRSVDIAIAESFGEQLYNGVLVAGFGEWHYYLHNLI